MNFSLSDHTNPDKECLVRRHPEVLSPPSPGSMSAEDERGEGQDKRLQP